MNIPKDKKWSGAFPGNYFGNIWASFNIDLERNPGRLSLADRMYRMSTGLGVVNKFIRTNATGTDQWFGLCSDDIIRNGISIITAGTYITDDTTNTFNDPKDGVIHESANGEERLLVTRAQKLAILNKTGGANVWDDDWGQAVAGLDDFDTNLEYHPIAKLQRLVAIGDRTTALVPVIHTIDKDDVVSKSRLTFDTGYEVRNIYTSSNRFWIGLQNTKGKNAKIIEWDGTSLTYNNEYEITGSAPVCGFVANDIPYFISDTGYIFRYSGGAFVKVADFGIQEHRQILDLMSNYSAHVDGDIVYLNIGMRTAGNFNSTQAPNGLRKQRPGIWIFNLKTGNLYHHRGLSEFTTPGTDISYGGIHGDTRSTGAVIKTSDVNILVASASIYVGGATWQASQANGIYRDARNDEQLSSVGRNRGYFITPFLPIADIEAMWEALTLKFKRFVSSENRIVLKWRVVDPISRGDVVDVSGNTLFVMQAPGTWVNTTSFTCKVPTGIAVGDEVEVLSGDNAGCSFKITALSGTPDSTTLRTVTIAEAAPTSSTDTSLFRFDNWKTEAAISDTTVGSKTVKFTEKAHGEFIQFKVELRGFDVQIDELIPVLKTKTASKQL